MNTGTFFYTSGPLSWAFDLEFRGQITVNSPPDYSADLSVSLNDIPAKIIVANGRNQFISYFVLKYSTCLKYIK